jgi:hypothetical protein
MRSMLMLTIAGATLVALTMTAVAPVAAQSNDRVPRNLGGVLDTLSGILGGTQNLHGHVVLVKGQTLVFRADNARTFAVDTSSLDPRVVGLLQPGDAVTLTLRAPAKNDTSQHAVVASAIQTDPAASSARVSYQRLDGTITETHGSQVAFKTSQGLELPVDTSTIQGLPAITPNEPATLIYEQNAQHAISAVWIEPGTSAASSPTSQPSASPPSTSQPSASIATGQQRVHGLVESVGLSSLMLNADDGRKLTIDVDGVDRTTRQSVRPGDVVTVVGRASTDANTLTADSIERDPGR